MNLTFTNLLDSHSIDLMVFLTSIRRALQQRSRMFLPTPIHLPKDSRAHSQSVSHVESLTIRFDRLVLFDQLLQEAAVIHSVEHGFPQLLPLGIDENL